MHVPLTALVLLSLARPAAAHPTGSPHRHVTTYGYRAEGGDDEIRGYLGTAGTLLAAVSQSGGPELVAAGGGGSLWAGLRLQSWLGFEAGWTGTFHGGATASADTSPTLHHVWAELKLHLPTRSRAVPFLAAGGGYALLGRSGTGVDFRGPSVQAGLGFDVWVSPFLTLGPEVRYLAADLQSHAGGPATLLQGLSMSVALAAHF